MNIVSCLLLYPWRTLLALAAVYDLPAHHRHPKEQVARKLSAAIHSRLSQTLASLDQDSRAALRALLQARDLALPRPDFIARFGPLNPYRPWQLHAPPAPWPTPPSPAAALLHHGLAYSLNLGTRQRPLHVVLLPHDLRAAVAASLDLPALPPTPLADLQTRKLADLQTCKLADSPDINADLFAFLSLLNRQDYPVRHGRWLPPRALQTLNDHLLPPDDLGPGRSELQTARIPFIHYLAERAGLVGITGGCLKPTLIAQEWLATPRPQRLRILWDAWREPSAANRALWRRYRLPALQEDDDPLARFHALLEALAACPVGSLASPTDLLDRLTERDPSLLRPQTTYAAWAALAPGDRAGFEDRARATLLALITGPLAWFGIIERVSESASQRDSEPASRQDSDPPLVSLSPLGAALLGRDDGAWLTDPTPTPLRVAPILEQETEEPTILLDTSPGFPLLDRFALEAIAPPDHVAPTPGDAVVPGRYRLTRPRLLRALQRGHTVEGVLNLLERASGEPLPAPPLGALYRWADEFDRLTIRQTVLLQTRAPGLLRDLASQRHIRQTLGKTLNTHTIEVRADRLDALLRRLARRGIFPHLDLPSTDAPPALAGEGAEGQAERAAIAAALRIYAHLADTLGLPTRPAYALARRWSTGLPLPLRDTVDQTVERTLEALHRAAPPEMEDRLPKATGPLLESLEAAIREQTTVEIEYYTAGRAHHTTRRVEPLRLEWRGDVVYLIAYCHLRQDQRVFRVDRIGRIENGEWRIENRE
ncbi:MAG: WYL domain-containing protein [Chloroflexota bacterium]|nr:WYL domain-containing protein [Chloroflexota bacterium]